MPADTTIIETLDPGEAALNAAEREELQNPGYEIFIAGLSVLSILNMVLHLRSWTTRLSSTCCYAMNALLSGVLFLDFCCAFGPPSRSRATSSDSSGGPTCWRACR